MDLGQWDKAILKSVSWCALFYIVYLFSSMSFPSDQMELLGHFVTLMLSIGIYLIFCFIGWLFWGMPSHWLISKYTSGNIFYYLLSGILFFILVFVFTSMGLAKFDLV